MEERGKRGDGNKVSSKKEIQAKINYNYVSIISD